MMKLWGRSKAHVAHSSAVEAVLLRDVLLPWLPRSVDQGGGFHQNFARDWQKSADSSKDLVYQARLTWCAAKGAQRYPHHAADFGAALLHGVDWLLTAQRDSVAGGFFWAVDRTGSPSGPGGREKHAYGNSFAIFALAAAYRVTGDSTTLRAAIDTFDWLIENFSDETQGGFREVPGSYQTSGNHTDSIGTPYGLKSSNTHLHLLESFTELYEVSGLPHVRVRLEALLSVVTHKLVLADGTLGENYSPDWVAVPAPQSFGHEFETAYLIDKAARALYGQVDVATLALEHTLVNGALAGIDRTGGVMHRGSRGGKTLDRNKIWWVQAEALNALSFFASRPQGGRYEQPFADLWSFITKHQIDHIYGGWYPQLNARGRPRGTIKSDGWTDAYHQARALMLVADRLRANEQLATDQLTTEDPATNHA